MMAEDINKKHKGRSWGAEADGGLGAAPGVGGFAFAARVRQSPPW